MKKLFPFLFVLLLIFSGGCSKPNTSTYNPADYKRTYNIIDEAYLNMITAILNNPSDYLGSTINIEGMFKSENGQTFVYRNGPECCYPEGLVCGLEFEGDTDSLAENDWIKISGTLSYYQTDESYAIILKDCSIKKTDARGLETVSHDHPETETIIETIE